MYYDTTNAPMFDGSSYSSYGAVKSVSNKPISTPTPCVYILAMYIPLYGLPLSSVPSINLISGEITPPSITPIL